MTSRMCTTVNMPSPYIKVIYRLLDMLEVYFRTNHMQGLIVPANQRCAIELTFLDSKVAIFGELLPPNAGP